MGVQAMNSKFKISWTLLIAAIIMGIWIGYTAGLWLRQSIFWQVGWEQSWRSHFPGKKCKKGPETSNVFPGQRVEKVFSPR